MTRCWWTAGSVLLAGLVGCGIREGSVKDEPRLDKSAAQVSVQTEAARIGTVAEIIEGLGRCEAIPDHVAVLTPAVEGHVQELLVRQGEPVKQGQPIVELDKAVAQADLDEKTAARDGLRASLTLLKSLPRPEEQEPHLLAIEQARVAVERAQAIVDKLKPLRSGNLASEQQIFDAEKAVETARLQRQTAESQLRVLMIGPRPEAVAEAEARIVTAESLVEFSRAHLDFHTIRAPIDGILDSLTCHPGQTIAIGTPIGQVVDIRKVYATVWIPPSADQRVRAGQLAHVEPAEVVGEGNATAGGSVALNGRVESVGQVTDPQTGNLPVRVLVDNPDGLLALGQTVRVELVIGERDNALQVPAMAIFDQGEGPMLGVVRDGKAHLLHPEVGLEHGGWVVVSGVDLAAGEPVIVEGAYALPEGTPVKVEDVRAVARVEVRR